MLTYVCKCLDISWPVHSYYLNPIDFYLWSRLKQLVDAADIYGGHLEHLLRDSELIAFLTLGSKSRNPNSCAITYLRNERFFKHMFIWRGRDEESAPTVHKRIF